MKRKNIFLQYSVIQVLFGVIFLLFLYSLEQDNMESTIGAIYYQDVREAMEDASAVLSQQLSSSQEDFDLEGEIPRDMAALLLEGEEYTNLNPENEAWEMAAFLRNHFIPSPQGKALLTSGQAALKRIEYRDERQFPRSFYVSVRFLDDTAGTPVLLLAKDLSVWDTFLLNAKSILFIIVLFYMGLMLFSHRVLVRKIREPIVAMTEVAFRYSQNNFDQTAPVKANDEVGNLATALNKLGKAMEASNIMNTQEREMLDYVLESLPVGIIYVDRDHTVTAFNSLGREMHAAYFKSREEGMSEELHEDYLEIINEVFRDGVARRIEIQQMQKFLDIRFSPIYLEAQSIVKGTLLLIEDITNAKRVNNIREELIANISHDLRTPLSSIKGYSEAIIDNVAESEAEKVEMAQIIFDEASEMNHTINSILELARMQAGYQELNLQLVELHRFFEHIVSRFGNTLRQESIVAQIAIEDGLRYYEMDKEKMAQAIYNLIDNSIRYAAEAGTRRERFIHIRVRLDKVRDEVLFEVVDNGIGIAQESLPYIFERFYKDDKARTKRKQHGTGIGLSLVQSIVEAHAGKIEVDSRVNEGTTFTIHLPYHDLTVEEVNSPIISNLN